MELKITFDKRSEDLLERLVLALEASVAKPTAEPAAKAKKAVAKKAAPAEPAPVVETPDPVDEPAQAVEVHETAPTVEPEKPVRHFTRPELSRAGSSLLDKGVITPAYFAEFMGGKSLKDMTQDELDRVGEDLIAKGAAL